MTTDPRPEPLDPDTPRGIEVTANLARILAPAELRRRRKRTEEQQQAA